jgi:hypothetical protein
MYRIASHFWLQRLKWSMSGDARDFNNIKTRAVINFFFVQGKAPKEIFHLWWASSWMTQNSDHPGDYWSNSRANLARLPDLQPRRNWPTWASNVLFTHPILQIWPCWTITCSLDWKYNWKVTIFHPVQRSLLLQRPGWTDNLMNFFWVACKR